MHLLYSYVCIYLYKLNCVKKNVPVFSVNRELRKDQSPLTGFFFPSISTLLICDVINNANNYTIKFHV